METEGFKKLLKKFSYEEALLFERFKNSSEKKYLLDYTKEDWSFIEDCYK